MELKPLRWAGFVALACLVVAVVVLPFSRSEGPVATSASEGRYWSELVKLRAATGRRSAAIRGYDALDALARWRAADRAAPGSAVIVDGSVPAAARARVDSGAQSLWKQLGERASAERGALFVYFDTTSVLAGASTGLRRPPVEVFFALPPPLAGAASRWRVSGRPGTRNCPASR